MPARIVFRHPETGQFISRATAEELGEVSRLEIGDSGVTEIPYSFDEEEEERDYDPYDLSPSRWGGRIMDDEGDLDLDRLGSMGFPSGMVGFRVTFSGVSRYQTGKNTEGYMSSSWYAPDQWPPDESWLEDNGAKGIANIVFELGD